MPKNRPKTGKFQAKWLISWTFCPFSIKIQRYRPQFYVFDANKLLLRGQEPKISVDLPDFRKDIALMTYQQMMGQKILGDFSTDTAKVIDFNS